MKTDRVDVLIAGGGPVGATLALALRGSGLSVTLVEPAERTHPGLRPIALSAGSRLILERLHSFDPALCTPIESIEVSQAGGFGRTLIEAAELDVEALGYVHDLGPLATALQARVEAERVAGRVTRWDTAQDGAQDGLLQVELADAPCAAMATRLLVLADGGHAGGDDLALRHYEQHALVCSVTLERPAQGRAWERFTPDGPLALLPFGAAYALIWTIQSTDHDALMRLTDEAFAHRLQAAFGRRAGRVLEVGPRSAMPLHLRYRRDPVAGARVVVAGNAAQSLHPVAGQGLNLGLRDAYELAQLLRRTVPSDIGQGAFLAAYRHQRQSDRLGAIGLTDTLIRVFSNNDALLRGARGLGLAALDLLPGARRFFGRRMIFGIRNLP